MVGQIKGLREVNKAFADIRRRIDDDTKAAIVRAAGPIAAEARSNLARYQGADIAKIRPEITSRAIYVTDFAQPHTGLRGDFGSLLMIGIWQAVQDNTEPLFQTTERAVDMRTIKEGF